MDKITRYDCIGIRMEESPTGAFVRWTDAADRVVDAFDQGAERKEWAKERFKVKNGNDPVICGVHSAGAYFDWGWKGCGHGQLSFSMNRSFTGDGEDAEVVRKWTCSNEGMSRDDVRKLLHALADHIADNVELDI